MTTGKGGKVGSNPISYSERRLRQVRAAAAVFGREWRVLYPATREGFRAYWRHARMMRWVVGVQWERALPRPEWEGNGFRPQRNGHLGYVYPDRVWTHTDYPEWAFRYGLLVEQFHKPATHLPDGMYNQPLLEKAHRRFFGTELFPRRA